MGKENDSKMIFNKSNSQHFRDYNTWKSENKINKADFTGPEYKQEYYKFLKSQYKDISLNQCETLFKVTTSRESKIIKNNNKPIVTQKERQTQNIINNKQEEYKKTIHKNTKKSQGEYRSFNKKFDKWLSDTDKDTERNRTSVHEDINAFLIYLKEEKGYPEATIGNYKTGIYAIQDAYYFADVKKYPHKELRRAVRLHKKINEKRNMTIQISKGKTVDFMRAMNHINAIYTENFKANKSGYKKMFQQMHNVAAYFVEIKGLTDITKATADDMSDFFKYMADEKGFTTKTLKGYRTAANYYSRKGNWEYRNVLNAMTNQQLGLGKVFSAVVERAWNGEEIKKALTLAYNGTTKNKSNRRLDAYFHMLGALGLGLRHDEIININTKQLKELLNDKEQRFLKLTKTKGNVPRTISEKVIEFQDIYIKPLSYLLANSIENVYEYPFVDNFKNLRDKKAIGKTHLTKSPVTKWIYFHRSKFQMGDRISNKEIAKLNKDAKKREFIDIQRGELSLHGLRHTFATLMYQMYLDQYTLDLTNVSFRNKMYLAYVKYRKQREKNFIPVPDREEYYTNRGFHMFVCKEVSALCGHARYDITENYIVRKEGDKLIGLNMGSMREYELEIVDGELRATRIIEEAA